MLGCKGEDQTLEHVVLGLLIGSHNVLCSCLILVCVRSWMPVFSSATGCEGHHSPCRGLRALPGILPSTGGSKGVSGVFERREQPQRLYFDTTLAGGPPFLACSPNNALQWRSSNHAFWAEKLHRC